jgi:Subtilase family
MPDRHYFLPGQVILHLEHRKSLSYTTPGIKKAVDTFLGGPQIPPLWKDKFKGPDLASIITCPPASGKNAISLVLIMVTPFDPDPNQIIPLLLEMYDRLTNGSGVVTPIKIDPEKEIFLHSISPNWLFGSAQQMDSSGGPATLPLQAEPSHPNPGTFTFSDASADIQRLDNEGDEVDVAILDTVPLEGDISSAISNQDWPDRWLINDLLPSQNPPWIHSYPLINFGPWHELQQYRHVNNRYEMPDHGLFIAGIIHAIAPKANLRLYEVLNIYGLGSLNSIAWGLTKAYTDRPKHKKLILNCSLTMHIPVVMDGKLLQKDLEFPLEFKDPILLGHMTTPLDKIIEIINDPNIVVVAAAGNEANYLPAPDMMSGHHKIRPPARYPAAFEKVIGVGATPKYSKPPVTITPGINKHHPARYSNRCDVPQAAGVVTFGGGADKGNGVLGIYIHRFPVDDMGNQYRDNKTGWAWWAGTSFATAIISGILAKGVKAGKVTDASSAIGLLLGSVLSPNDNETVDAGEKVILVTQII